MDIIQCSNRALARWESEFRALAFQHSGHMDHEELVQVVRKYRKKFYAFEQRI